MCPVTCSHSCCVIFVQFFYKVEVEKKRPTDIISLKSAIQGAWDELEPTVIINKIPY